jgi:hypothetical protein
LTSVDWREERDVLLVTVLPGQLMAFLESSWQAPPGSHRVCIQRLAELAVRQCPKWGVCRSLGGTWWLFAGREAWVKILEGADLERYGGVSSHRANHRRFWLQHARIAAWAKPSDRGADRPRVACTRDPGQYVELRNGTVLEPTNLVTWGGRGGGRPDACGSF